MAGDQDSPSASLWDPELFRVEYVRLNRVISPFEDLFHRLPHRQSGRDLFQDDCVVGAAVLDRSKSPPQGFQHQTSAHIVQFAQFCGDFLQVVADRHALRQLEYLFQCSASRAGAGDSVGLTGWSTREDIGATYVLKFGLVPGLDLGFVLRGGAECPYITFDSP
ncbi:hypothetical protein ADZ36_12365 [Streptomyces fradiae]|uniref:Uncharacterized protein n=1 Tax=Streptomyces fradiae TaxID=1906 RepID=A0ACC4WC28_STRFR|nr:hypothetical protein ADZ36_12365 [Streptomyces fradiae]OFA56520.1 hypothetical protein BEN35_06130 [Streptomyces fradiae]